MKELINALEKIKYEFESIERPSLESEAPTMREETPPKARTPRISFLPARQSPKEKLELSNFETTTSESDEAQRGMSLHFTPIITLPLVRTRTTKLPETTREVEHLESLGITRSKSSDAEAQLSKLKLELELENHNRRDSMEGIIDWEFDEKIEKEPRKSI